MPPLSSRYVSPAEMVEELMKLTKVMGKVLLKELKGKKKG